LTDATFRPEVKRAVANVSADGRRGLSDYS